MFRLFVKNVMWVADKLSLIQLKWAPDFDPQRNIQ